MHLPLELFVPDPEHGGANGISMGQVLCQIEAQGGLPWVEEATALVRQGAMDAFTAAGVALYAMEPPTQADRMLMAAYGSRRFAVDLGQVDVELLARSGLARLIREVLEHESLQHSEHTRANVAHMSKSQPGQASE